MHLVSLIGGKPECPNRAHLSKNKKKKLSPLVTRIDKHVSGKSR